MYKLIQKGRWIYIRPFPATDLLNKIEKETSYVKKSARFMPNPSWGIIKLYQKKRGRFPIGLLSRIQNVLDLNKDEYNINIKITPPRTSIFTTTLRDYQVKAIKALYKDRGGILCMPTGSGKTRTAISYIDYLNEKTLVIVPTIDLKLQWEPLVPKNCVVKTYQSLKSKSFLQQFKLVIFDECHMVAAKTMQLIGMNLCEEAVTVGLSATPFMRDEDNLKVEAVLGQIVYEIKLRSLIEQGYLVDAEVYYHKLKKYENDFIDYQITYNDYIVNNIERNNKIIDIVDKTENYVLILVDRIDHGEQLESDLKVLGHSVRFINGKSKNRLDLNYRVIIATSIFDQGIDIPRLRILILGGGGKSSIRVVQRIGRVLRICDGKKNAIIHDFEDNCKWLYEHSKKRRKILKENFEIKEIGIQKTL